MQQRQTDYFTPAHVCRVIIATVNMEEQHAKNKHPSKKFREVYTLKTILVAMLGSNTIYDRKSPGQKNITIIMTNTVSLQV